MISLFFTLLVSVISFDAYSSKIESNDLPHGSYNKSCELDSCTYTNKILTCPCNRIPFVGGKTTSSLKLPCYENKKIKEDKKIKYDIANNDGKLICKIKLPYITSVTFFPIISLISLYTLVAILSGELFFS